MSARTLLVIAMSALLWASVGLVLGVDAFGLVALWAGGALSLLLALAAWRALEGSDQWMGPVLLAVGIASLAAFGVFILVKQGTNHRPLGAAVMAVLLLPTFAMALATGLRAKVNIRYGYASVGAAAALGVLSGALSWGWQVWLQCAVGAALFAICVYVQRRQASAGRAAWSTWGFTGVLLLNLALLMAGLPPSVQEAPVVLGLLGVLS